MFFRKKKKEILEKEPIDELIKNGQLYSGITKLHKQEQNKKTKTSK